MLFALSYALLFGLVVLEAIVLQGVLRRTVEIKRRFIHSARRDRPPQQLLPGTLAPKFTARVLGTRRTLASADLEGNFVMLLFVSPREAASTRYANLSVAIHALWHKAEGNLYVVCSGGDEACRQLMHDHDVDGLSDGYLPVILDEDGRIAKSFLISSTPQAVILDEEVRVSRYGQPLPTGEVSDGEG